MDTLMDQDGESRVDLAMQMLVLWSYDIIKHKIGQNLTFTSQDLIYMETAALLVYAYLDTCCGHFLTIIAGVDLHFGHESERFNPNNKPQPKINFYPYHLHTAVEFLDIRSAML